jgi:hypothetical protein
MLPDSVRGSASAPRRGIGERSPSKAYFFECFQMAKGS